MCYYLSGADYPKEEDLMNLKRTMMVALNGAAQKADAYHATLSKLP
jgi:hypothetical protein